MGCTELTCSLQSNTTPSRTLEKIASLHLFQKCPSRLAKPVAYIWCIIALFVHVVGASNNCKHTYTCPCCHNVFMCGSNLCAQGTHWSLMRHVSINCCAVCFSSSRTGATTFHLTGGGSGGVSPGAMWCNSRCAFAFGRMPSITGILRRLNSSSTLTLWHGNSVVARCTMIPLIFGTVDQFLSARPHVEIVFFNFFLGHLMKSSSVVHFSIKDRLVSMDKSWGVVSFVVWCVH